MTTVINTNVPAIIAKSNMDRVQRELESSIAKLSSGKRINKAADDAAGMAIANRMEAQIRGLTMAVRHGKDGQNLIDTADGAQIEISNMLQRMRELAVQASSDTLDSQNRAFLNAEATALKNEINRVTEQTRWNNLNLLDGTYTGKLFQVGFKGFETIDVSVDSSHSAQIGAYNLHSDTHVTSGANLKAATLVISGYLGSGSVTVAASGASANSSVEAIAAKINAVTKDTGVEASAVSKAKLHTFTEAGKIAFKLVGNRPTSGARTASNVTATLAATSDLDPLVTAINAKAAATGITATLGTNSSEIILTHSTGETIEIYDYVGATTDGIARLTSLDKYGNSSAAADATLNRAAGATDDVVSLQNVTNSKIGIVVGNLTLTSIKSFSVTGDNSNTEQGYFHTGMKYTGSVIGGGTSAMSNVANLTIDSQSNATAAIAVLDGAIAKIDQQRADLGAISNRLSSSIDNNVAMITNTESSKSHILDTDFAVETTKLTRTQILQQAATSMLAQANASKQSILALLQNM